jgi:hypothetical protein
MTDSGRRERHRSAELVGERLEQLEVFAASRTAPAGYDDTRRGELGPSRFGGSCPLNCDEPLSATGATLDQRAGRRACRIKAVMRDDLGGPSIAPSSAILPA